MADWTRRKMLTTGTAGVTAALAGLPAGVAAQPASGTPTRGGTVTIAVNQAPPSLDPHMTSAQVSRDVTLQMYETLYARDENAKAVPDLAEGVDISKDGLTYVFKLRSGVKFHNGKTMGGRDAAASVDRFRKIGVTANLLGAVDTIQATGRLEVTIKLKGVQSNFLDILSSPRSPIAIYPEEEAVKPPKEFGFIGSGPFKFVEYMPDSHVTIERFADYVPNPNYKTRDGFAGRKQVYIDKAVFRFMPDQGSQLAALLAGEIDILEMVASGPTAKQLGSNPQFKVFKVLPFALQFGLFNHAQPPCDDVNFRRAVSAALNMEETMAIAYPDIYDMDGGWVFKNSEYYTKAGLELYNINDQAKAKQWLQKSKYKGETLTFITDNARYDVDCATDMKEQLGQIGIKIDVKVSDWPTVSQVGFTPNGWHLWTHGQGIEPFEGPATQMSCFAAPNPNLYQIKDDPVIDRLYSSFKAEMDLEKRKAIFAQFQTHMYEDAVCMVLGNYGIFQAVNTKLKNFVPYRIPRLWGVWL
jgi:peptide/nickel transport system substrate-binding protein